MLAECLSRCDVFAALLCNVGAFSFSLRVFVVEEFELDEWFATGEVGLFSFEL